MKGESSMKVSYLTLCQWCSLALWVVFGGLTPAVAEPLGLIREPWLYGELAPVGADFELEFQTPAGPIMGRRASNDLARGSAFALPGQLVVDLPVPCETEFRELVVEDRTIKRLRYGVRKGLTRVIVDLRTKATPRFVVSFNEAGNRLAVRFDLGEGDLYPATFRATSSHAAVAQATPLEAPEKPARMDALALYDQFKESTQELVRDREAVRNAQVVADPSPAQPDGSRSLGELLTGGETDSHDGIGLIGLGLRIALVAIVGLAFLVNVSWGPRRGPTPRRSNGADVQLSRGQLAVYYQLLNVRENDSNATIKSRYRTLAKQFHSDTFAPGSRSERTGKIADERFRQIDEAYRALKEVRGID